MSGRKKRKVERGRWKAGSSGAFYRTEKGGLTMSKKIIGGLIAVLVVVVLGSRVAFANPADVSVLVTPGVTLSLTPTTTSYNFGTVDVNTSSGAVTPITITNAGTVGITLDKRIQTNAAGWTAPSAPGTPAADAYVLWVATAAVQPDYAGLNANCEFGAAAAVTTLTDTAGLGGGNVIPGATVTLWYKIDMPTTSGTGEEKTIVTRITATQSN